MREKSKNKNKQTKKARQSASYRKDRASVSNGCCKQLSQNLLTLFLCSAIHGLPDTSEFSSLSGSFAMKEVVPYVHFCCLKRKANLLQLFIPCQTLLLLFLLSYYSKQIPLESTERRRWPQQVFLMKKSICESFTEKSTHGTSIIQHLWLICLVQRAEVPRMRLGACSPSTGTYKPIGRPKNGQFQDFLW